MYSDRLKLTMGPIVKVLNKKSINPKYKFKSGDNCFDLRKANNKYIISPGESIVILTNERIKLNGKYACLIIPRISLSDVGVVVTTAYIDPYYNGVLRLQLSNLSDKSFELNFLEIVAQCFFFELSDYACKKYEEEFKTKSVFYGQTWQGILNSDRNPFPTKKSSASVDKFLNLKYQWEIIWSFIKKHSLIFALFTNIVIILCSYANFKQNYEKLNETIGHIETIFEPIATEIIIEPGNMYGEKIIEVKHDKSDIISVLCNNDDVGYKIISGNTEDESKIVFFYNIPSEQTVNYEVNFTYTIIRRAEQ